jgi:hypothetical protein
MISSPYLSIASRARRRLQLFSNSRCFRRSSRTALRARRLRKRLQHDLMVGRVAFLIDPGRPLPPQTRPRCARRLLHGDRASSTLCPSCCLRHILYSCARTASGCRTARPDLGWRWPSRLVATAAEDRLNTQSAHIVLRRPAIVEQSRIYEYVP